MEQTTDQAFEVLLNSEYFWSFTGLSRNARYQFISMLRTGKGITIDKKKSLLEKAGFSVKQEMTWNLPK